MSDAVRPMATTWVTKVVFSFPRESCSTINGTRTESQSMGVMNAVAEQLSHTSRVFMRPSTWLSSGWWDGSLARII